MPRVLLALLVFAGGCAQLPPERVERDRIIMAAVQPCKERYAERLYNDGMMSVNRDGSIHYRYKGDPIGSHEEIDRCIADARKGVKVGPAIAAKLVKSGPASVAITTVENEVLVPVRLNGVPGTMALSTRSEVTFITAAYAARAGVRVAPESPAIPLTVRGDAIVVPYARVLSLEVGDVAVERLDAAVHEAVARVDGVLGNSFLALFKLNIDRRNNRLTLEPLARP
jgi:hypothetical protein